MAFGKRNSKSKTRSKDESTIPPPSARPCRKKTLLVSILTRDAEQEAAMAEQIRAGNPNAVIEPFVPHRDMLAMKKVLKEKYGYQEDDIVVMLEHGQECDGADPMLLPTHVNLVREMKRLVRDARSGDRFFFHYSGHAIQKPCKKNTEEDGMDEYIVPCDDDEENNKAIKDNLLREILVDSLPVGASLVAVFDSCNSGSLLDLSHHRCNRVYVPWLSKGKRHSATLRNGLARQGAILTEGLVEPVTVVNVMKSHTRTIYDNRRTNPKNVHSRKTTIVVDRKPVIAEKYKLAGSATMPNISKAKRLSFGIGINKTPPTGLEYKSTTKSRTLSLKSAVRLETTEVSKAPSLPAVVEFAPLDQPVIREPVVAPQAEFFTASAIPVIPMPTWYYSDNDEMEVPRCESPAPQFECDGWCRNRKKGGSTSSESGKTTVNGDEMADVMSMSASKDSQTAWEDPAYRSLTNILVEVLSQDPNPSLHKLMVDVSHKIHRIGREMHHSIHKYHADRKRYPSLEYVPGLDMVNFQNPQLASHVPLDKERVWVI